MTDAVDLSAVEASAPSVLRLCTAGASALFVCLDRRVGCRMKRRDQPVPWETPLEANRQALRALVEGLGLRAIGESWEITLETREQGGPGIHWQGPLARAVWSAAQRIDGGREEGTTGLATAWRGPSPLPGWERAASLAAVLGGVVFSEHSDCRIAAVDPGWVEERISLFDITALGVGPVSPAPETGAGPEEGVAMLRALEARDHATLKGFVEDDRARAGPAPSDEVAQRLVDLGVGVGAAITFRSHGDGAGGLLVAWHRPGQGSDDPATTLGRALKALGARPIVARLDLLGMEVE